MGVPNVPLTETQKGWKTRLDAQVTALAASRSDVVLGKKAFSQDILDKLDEIERDVLADERKEASKDEAVSEGMKDPKSKARVLIL